MQTFQRYGQRSTRQIENVPYDDGRPSPEEEAAILARYGKTVMKGRCQHVSEFYPEVTLKTIAKEFNRGILTVMKIIRRGRKRR